MTKRNHKYLKQTKLYRNTMHATDVVTNTIWDHLIIELTRCKIKNCNSGLGKWKHVWWGRHLFCQCTINRLPIKLLTGSIYLKRSRYFIFKITNQHSNSSWKSSVLSNSYARRNIFAYTIDFCYLNGY